MTEQKQPTFIKIEGKTHDANIAGNTVFGGNLLDASDAEVSNLTLAFNKVYGGLQPVRLGDVFGAEIVGNFADMRIPESAVAEIKEAAKSEPKKRFFLDRLKQVLTSPAEIEALSHIVENIHRHLPT